MRKPHNCWCVGTWKAKILRWGLLKTGAKGWLLYCKDCRHEWWSKRVYAASIAPWRKRTRSGMTDQDILNRILSGSLRVLEVNGAVIVESDTHRGTERLTQIERQVHEYTTYRFVSICSGGKKKKVAVHKLNWMFHNKSLVPEGFHVDHANGRGDVIDNLQLLTQADNCDTRSVPKYDPNQMEMQF